LSGFFTYALKKRRLIASSPMAGVEAPALGSERDRVLSDAEIPVMWRATSALSPWNAGAVKLLLATGLRLREASGIRLDDIVEDGRLLVLAPSRTKNGREHRLPLSSFAREIIAEVPRVDGSPFLFSSSGKLPVNSWDYAKKKLDGEMRRHGWNGQPFVLHDLRRTTATMLARQGTAIHVTEKVLNHASGTISGIAAIYNRHSYATEMAEALEGLGETLRGLVAGGGDALAA
jgi:integrase